jgi:hypothetical protein
VLSAPTLALEAPTNANDLNVEAPVQNVEAHAPLNKDFGLPLLDIPTFGTADTLFGKINNGDNFNLQLPKIEIGKPLEQNLAPAV